MSPSESKQDIQLFNTDIIVWVVYRSAFTDTKLIVIKIGFQKEQ